MGIAKLPGYYNPVIIYVTGSAEPFVTWTPPDEIAYISLSGI